MSLTLGSANKYVLAIILPLLLVCFCGAFYLCLDIRMLTQQTHSISAEDLQEAAVDHVHHVEKSKLHASYQATLWKLNQNCDSSEELLDQTNWRERLVWVSEGKVF